MLFAFGESALAFASVYFVTSALLVYSVGVFVAASGRGSVRDSLVGVFKVPAVWAVAAALLTLTFHWTVPPPVMRPVSLLGDAAIPSCCWCSARSWNVTRGQSIRRSRQRRRALAGRGAGHMPSRSRRSPEGLEGAARQAAIVEASMPAAVATTVLALCSSSWMRICRPAWCCFSTLLSPFTLVLLIAYLKGAVG